MYDTLLLFIMYVIYLYLSFIIKCNIIIYLTLYILCNNVILNVINLLLYYYVCKVKYTSLLNLQNIQSSIFSR